MSPVNRGIRPTQIRMHPLSSLSAMPVARIQNPRVMRNNRSRFPILQVIFISFQDSHSRRDYN